MITLPVEMWCFAGQEEIPVRICFGLFQGKDKLNSKLKIHLGHPGNPRLGTAETRARTKRRQKKTLILVFFKSLQYT